MFRRPCALAPAWATPACVDMMVATLTDPFGAGHMGITAENLADKMGHLAARSRTRWRPNCTPARRPRSRTAASNRRSSRGQENEEGRCRRRHRRACEARHDGSNPWPSCRPAFKKDGTVTAGNASGVNDAASFFVLADAAARASRGPEAAWRGLFPTPWPACRTISWAKARSRPRSSRSRRRAFARPDGRHRG